MKDLNKSFKYKMAKAAKIIREIYRNSGKNLVTNKNGYYQLKSYYNFTKLKIKNW